MTKIASRGSCLKIVTHQGIAFMSVFRLHVCYIHSCTTPQAHSINAFSLLPNGACAHYVMVSKFQWKPFWLATQRDPQNDWTATQNRVNYDVFAQAPSLSSYNLRKPRQLILPRLRTSRHLHSFLYIYNSARLWNSLPHSLQSIPNHAQFRKALSHHWKEHQCKPFFHF